MRGATRILPFLGPGARTSSKLTFCCTAMDKHARLECEEDPAASTDDWEPTYDERGVFIPDCPQKLVAYVSAWRQYGLVIHDGPYTAWKSYFHIYNCPWCGTDLRPSYRHAWFDRLAAGGLEPEDDLPPELNDEGWWQETSDPPQPDSHEPSRRVDQWRMGLSQEQPCCELVEFELNSVDSVFPDPWDNMDRVIGFGPDGTAGLIVHDGRRSLEPISFCPWCAAPAVTELK